MENRMQTEVQFPQAGWLSAWLGSFIREPRIIHRSQPAPVRPWQPEVDDPVIPEDEHERSEEGKLRIHEAQREQRFISQRGKEEVPYP